LALEARACCCMCPLLFFLVVPSKSTKIAHKTAPFQILLLYKPNASQKSEYTGACTITGGIN
jgi:hypothetical protein